MGYTNRSCPFPCYSLTLEASETAALLKTPEKTYSLRQKNTSNSLFLLAPTRPVPPSSPTTTMLPSSPGLLAIATIHETVELIPEAKQAAAPAPTAKGKWHERFGRSR